jgi:hypothetical protein
MKNSKKHKIEKYPSHSGKTGSTDRKNKNKNNSNTSFVKGE